MTNKSDDLVGQIQSLLRITLPISSKRKQNHFVTSPQWNKGSCHFTDKESIEKVGIFREISSGWEPERTLYYIIYITLKFVKNFRNASTVSTRRWEFHDPRRQSSPCPNSVWAYVPMILRFAASGSHFATCSSDPKLIMLGVKTPPCIISVYSKPIALNEVHIINN